MVLAIDDHPEEYTSRSPASIQGFVKTAFLLRRAVSESAGSISKGSGSESLEVLVFALGECDMRVVKDE
jgi:hypothetical protein